MSDLNPEELRPEPLHTFLRLAPETSKPFTSTRLPHLAPKSICPLPTGRFLRLLPETTVPHHYAPGRVDAADAATVAQGGGIAIESEEGKEEKHDSGVSCASDAGDSVTSSAAGGISLERQ